MSRTETESDNEQHMLQYKQYVKLRSNVRNQIGSRVMNIEPVTVHNTVQDISKMSHNLQRIRSRGDYG